MDHTVLPAINTIPALPRKHSPDGASIDATHFAAGKLVIKL